MSLIIKSCPCLPSPENKFLVKNENKPKVLPKCFNSRLLTIIERLNKINEEFYNIYDILSRTNQDRLSVTKVRIDLKLRSFAEKVNDSFLHLNIWGSLYNDFILETDNYEFRIKITKVYHYKEIYELYTKITELITTLENLPLKNSPKDWKNFSNIRNEAMMRIIFLDLRRIFSNAKRKR